MEFVWNERNISHIAKHGIEPHEAEFVVNHAQAPYPEMIGEGKRLVIGRLPDGGYVQVIYVASRSVEDAAYVVHSRPLTDTEKRRFRKRI